MTELNDFLTQKIGIPVSCSNKDGTTRYTHEFFVTVELDKTKNRSLILELDSKPTIPIFNFTEINGTVSMLEMNRVISGIYNIQTNFYLDLKKVVELVNV